MHNAGLVRLGEGIVYDVHHLPDGTPNSVLTRLAVDVNSARAPLSAPVQDFRVSPFDPSRFHAHLSLASFELIFRPDLTDE